jgi:MFS transporter, MHS family, proline/betaine transporter
MTATLSAEREAAAAPSIPPANQKQVLGAVAASTLGWALDLFDLFTLLYVAPVIGKLFFPSTHAMLSLAAVYASFAVTLLMRPIGSALFGSYADRNGRKGAMIVAVVGVGLSTACFGLLPTVHQVGLVAPVIFLALRLVQGVFVGGVVASTHTIGTESVAPKWRGAVSGLIGGGGAGLGALLASAAYLVMSAIFPGEAFEAWGWRCMFFLGVLSSGLGLFVFRTLEESPMWKQATRSKVAKARSPLKALFSGEYRNILLVNLLLTIGGGSSYYLTSGYLPTFLKVVTHTPNAETALILMASSIGLIVGCVAAGHLSTLIGRKKAFLLIGVVQLVARPALYVWLPDAGGVFMTGLGVVLLSLLGSIGYAPLLIFLNERFPTAIRSTGTGLSWNIGFAVGGMMPTFVSLVAATPAELPVTLAWFVGAVGALFLIGAAVVPETQGRLEATS